MWEWNLWIREWLLSGLFPFLREFYWLYIYPEFTVIAMIVYMDWQRRRSERKHDADMQRLEQTQVARDTRCPRCGWQQPRNSD